MSGRRGLARVFLLAGCGCLIVMVPTHVAEAMHWLPGMGWGLPNSPGHYLDLFSAVSGVALVLTAGVLRLLLQSETPPSVEPGGFLVQFWSNDRLK